MGNGKPITATYIRFEWYQLQMILNDRNNTGYFEGQAPFDFGYTYDHIQGLGNFSVPAAPQGGLIMFWLVKGLQATTSNGKGPELGSGGWSWNVADLDRMYRYATPLWRDFAPADRVTAMTAYVQYWLSKATSFTPQQYYQGGWTTAATVPDTRNPAQGFANSMAFVIPQFLYLAVNPTLATQMANWAKTVWPNYNWAALLTIHCVPGSPTPTCSL